MHLCLMCIYIRIYVRITVEQINIKGLKTELSALTRNGIILFVPVTREYKHTTFLYHKTVIYQMYILGLKLQALLI